MSPQEKKFKVTVEYPVTDLKEEKKRDLEEKMKNAMVNTFPELAERDELMILARPKVG